MALPWSLIFNSISPPSGEPSRATRCFWRTWLCEETQISPLEFFFCPDMLCLCVNTNLGITFVSGENRHLHVSDDGIFVVTTVRLSHVVSCG